MERKGKEDEGVVVEWFGRAPSGRHCKWGFAAPASLVPEHHTHYTIVDSICDIALVRQMAR
jgi:hypothetical protein